MNNVKTHYMKCSIGAMRLCAVLSLLVFVLLSCEKSGSREYIDRMVVLPSFDTLRVEGPINVYLLTDTANSMVISGSTPIVDDVHFRVSNGTLILSSDYPYKMFRPTSNKAEIRLMSRSLSRIDIAEGCGIRSTDTLTGDEMGLVVMSKYAEVDLTINSRSFYYWDYSLSGGKVKLSGQTDVLKIWNFALMTVDASSLEAQSVICENSARSPCYVRASQKLHYSILGQGDIWYYGDPPVILPGEISSSGRLKKAD